MKEMDNEGFEEIRAGINKGLHYNNWPALKSIATMQTPETDFRKVLVQYKPEPTDEGVSA